MADLKSQAKSRVSSARSARTASATKRASSSSSKSSSKPKSSSSSLKSQAKARPKPQPFKLYGDVEDTMREAKERKNPEWMPPLPPASAIPIPPGSEATENPVAPIDPYLFSFAKIPGLRKRDAGAGGGE